MIRHCLWDPVLCVWRCFRASAVYWAAIPKAKIATMAVCGALATQLPEMRPDTPRPPIAVQAPAPEPSIGAPKFAVVPGDAFRPLPDDFVQRVRGEAPRQVVDVPEPGSLMLFAAGLVALWGVRRKNA